MTDSLEFVCCRRDDDCAVVWWCECGSVAWGYPLGGGDLDALCLQYL